jgi:hypothetical protein
MNLKKFKDSSSEDFSEEFDEVLDFLTDAGYDVDEDKHTVVFSVSDDHHGPFTESELKDILGEKGYDFVEDLFVGYPSKQGLYITDESLGEGWSVEEFCSFDDLNELLKPYNIHTGNIDVEKDGSDSILHVNLLKD